MFRWRFFVCVVLFFTALFVFASDFCKDRISARTYDDVTVISIELCAEKTQNDGKSDEALDEIDRILKEFYSILPAGVPKNGEEITEAFGVEAILGDILEGLGNEGGSDIKEFFFLVASSLALLLILEFTVGEGDLYLTASSASQGVLALPVFFALAPLFEEVAQGLREADAFFSGLLPLAVGITGAGGAVGTAAAIGSGFGFVLSFVGNFLSKSVLPLAVAVFVLALAESVDNMSLGRVTGGIKKCLTLTLGVSTTLITGIFAIQTSVAASQDTLTLRGIKYAVSNMVPAVGGVISGSLSTLNAGVGYAVGVMGGASVYAVLSILILPMIRLLLFRLILGMAATVCDMFSSHSAKRLFAAFSSATDALIAVLSSSGIIYVLETVIFMKQGGIFS